jgi:hypothetical protein
MHTSSHNSLCTSSHTPSSRLFSDVIVFMGGVLSSASQTIPIDSSVLLIANGEHEVNDDISSEILRLRRMVKDRTRLILLEKYVFMFFCPPNYPSNSTAEYISDRLNIPIFPLAEMENLCDVMRDQKYENGFILRTFPSNLIEVKTFNIQIEALGLKLCLFFFEVDGEVSIKD